MPPWVMLLPHAGAPNPGAASHAETSNSPAAAALGMTAGAVKAKASEAPIAAGKRIVLFLLLMV
jgi:hypothetical protein